MYQQNHLRCDPGAGRGYGRQSYKFQRLREQLRQAILTGEFEARLPGERELGRRYSANPKTINKALCDLSSEGLVVRQIGRGTFLADQNGEAAVAPRSRAFTCLLAPASQGPPHREALIGAIRKKLVSDGHACAVQVVEPTPDSGRIPLIKWKPALRQATDGLISYPGDPLSGADSRFSDALVFETLRRHVPVVVAGAHAQGASLNAVVPDYVDAGFRLSEYLFRIGHTRVIVVQQEGCSREAEEVVGGCRSAATRYHGGIAEAALDPAGNGTGLSALQAQLGATNEQPGEGGASSKSGPAVVCVGAQVLRTVLGDRDVSALRQRGRLDLACVLEPGDEAGETAGVTEYGVDAGQVAAWAARLLVGARPGQRPVEVIVPGVLKIRDPRNGHDVASRPGPALGAAMISSVQTATVTEAIL